MSGFLHKRDAFRDLRKGAHSRRFKISAPPESFLILFPMDRQKRRPMSCSMISTIVNSQQMPEFWESQIMRPIGCHLSKIGEEEQNGARKIQVGCREGERIHLHNQNTFEKICDSQQVLDQDSDRSSDLGKNFLYTDDFLDAPKILRHPLSCRPIRFDGRRILRIDPAANAAPHNSERSLPRN
jgi:hypothetical protein